MDFLYWLVSQIIYFYDVIFTVIEVLELETGTGKYIISVLQFANIANIWLRLSTKHSMVWLKKFSLLRSRGLVSSRSSKYAVVMQDSRNGPG